MASRAADKSYLELHGKSWRVQVRVPSKLVEFIGTTKLVTPLHTDSLAVANLRKHKAIHDLKQQLAKAALELRGRGKQAVDPLAEEGLEWRAAFKAEADAGDGGPDSPDNVAHALDWRVEELKASEGEDKASMLALIATGRGTPISLLIDDYLREKAFRPRQAHEYRRTIRGFETWLVSSAKLPGTVETVTRRVVSDWRRDTLVQAGVHWKTGNRAVSALSSFWRWLEQRGHVTGESPWTKQSLPKAKPSGARAGTSSSAKKRAFTNSEAAALLSAPDVSPLLRDVMLTAALTGARIEEICNIRVGDLTLTESGTSVETIPFIALRGTKTEAADRVIPIHPDLMTLVKRRTKGKAPKAWLFHDLRDVPDGSIVERSQPISKAFTRLRRRLADAGHATLDERETGARQSSVDFHSWRRFFIRSAAEALNGGAKGYSAWTLAEVVGHSREEMPLGMTMGRYAGDHTMEAKAACVRAVRLPGPS